MQQAVAETLPSAMEARFDDRLARSSLQFYDLTTVPAVRGGVPPEVSKIHFRSDLSRAAHLNEAEVAGLAPAGLVSLPLAMTTDLSLL